MRDVFPADEYGVDEFEKTLKETSLPKRSNTTHLDMSLDSTEDILYTKEIETLLKQYGNEKDMV